MHSSGGPLSNAARNLGQLRSATTSWTWALAVLLIHLAIEVSGGVDRMHWLYARLGLDRDDVLQGNFWQFLSYGLLHGNWWHAVINALFVLLVGSRIEHMAGSKTTNSVVAAGIFGGGLFHLILGNGLLVGLSGGCLSLMLMLTTLSPQSRMMPIPVSGKSLGLGILLAALLLALLDPSLQAPGFAPLGERLVDLGFGSWFKMGHACHLGGGLAGWMCGRWLLRPRVTLDRLRRDRARREAE
jgi:membrane associated rhomboid family serine protease